MTLQKGESVLRLSVRGSVDGIMLGDTADRLGTFEQPVAIAASDENTLFVAERETKKIKRFDVATKATTDIVSSEYSVEELLFTDGALFWTSYAGVKRTTPSGGDVLPLASEHAASMVAKDGRLYYLASNVVRSVPLDGTGASRRETGWLGHDTPNSGLTNVDAFGFDGATLVAVQNKTFYEVTFGGAEPRALFRAEATDTFAPTFLRIDAQRYVWPSPPGIWSAPRPI